MKKIQKRGITIVTLVITVIVLAVLTGAVMLTMVGDNGIFGETQSTIDKYNKQAMLEQIQLKIQKKRLAKVNEGQYSLKLEEDILPILETFGTYNANEMKLTTTEKNIDIYLYEIVNIPINEIANVIYANEELTITEKVSLPNGYTFEYTKDNGITWSEYTTTTTITEENGILIRLKNEEGKVVSSEYKVTSGVIEEIDSTKPIISIDTNGVTTGKTIKVTIIVTDEKGLDRNNTYEYCITTSNNDTTNATWIPYTNGISFTVGEGLTGGYYIHVKGVTDTAGNESVNKVSEMLTFDNTVPAVTIDIGRITDTSIEILAQSTDNSGQVKSTEYSIDNGQTWKTNNIFTNLTQNTSYTVKVKSVDIFNNENIQEKQVTTNPRTWNGKIDISWYTRNPNKTTFDISTPNELAGLAILTNNETVYYSDTHDANSTSGTYSIAGTDFEGKTIVLNNDIDLNYGTTIEYEETTGLVNIDVNGNKYTIGTGVEKYVDSNNELQTITSVSTEGQIRNSSGTIITEIPNLNQWTPIGIYEEGIINRPFKGVFDGKDYTISEIYIYTDKAYQGLLGIVENGMVKNVNVSLSYIYSLGRDLWCYSDGDIYTTRVGSVVGYGINSSISNSSSSAYVQGVRHVGGIVGCLEAGSTISNCKNFGVVIGNDTDIEVSDGVFWSAIQIGGVCGAFQDEFEEMIMRNCVNYGFVYNEIDQVGGVAGFVRNGRVVDSMNYGYVIGSSSTGGIVGLLGESTVGQVKNYGFVYAMKEPSGHGGGIVGFVWLGGYNCIIYNSCNLGSVYGGNSGGIIAYCGTGMILNCWNEGYVDGSGIIAYGNSIVYNCYNIGNVGHFGIVAGMTLHAEIRNVYNLNANVASIYGTYNDGTNNHVPIIENIFGVNGKSIVSNNWNDLDLSTCKTFDPTTLTFSDGTTLLSALNAWVNANKSTYPELKNWVMGSDGYPTLDI